MERTTQFLLKICDSDEATYPLWRRHILKSVSKGYLSPWEAIEAFWSVVPEANWLLTPEAAYEHPEWRAFRGSSDAFSRLFLTNYSIWEQQFMMLSTQHSHEVPPDDKSGRRLMPGLPPAPPGDHEDHVITIPGAVKPAALRSASMRTKRRSTATSSAAVPDVDLSKNQDIPEIPKEPDSTVPNETMSEMIAVATACALSAPVPKAKRAPRAGTPVAKKRVWKRVTVPQFTPEPILRRREPEVHFNPTVLEAPAADPDAMFDECQLDADKDDEDTPEEEEDVWKAELK